MNPPEKLPPSKPADLVAAKVPWGARKPAALSPPPAPPAPPEPTPAAAPAPVPASPPPALSAKKVPWGSRKAPPPSPPPGLPPSQGDPSFTHMPWAESTLPPPAATPASVAAPKKSLFAKLVPWGSHKKPVAPPTDEALPEESPRAIVSTWALPKGATAEQLTQEEMDFVREQRPADDREPTAEQLVAYLSKLPSRKGSTPETTATPNATAPYKARPISFEPTRWEVVLLWAHAYRGRLSVGSTLLVLTLTTAYLMKLVSLNGEIDRQWRTVETALRDRYALAPAYVTCIETYSDTERYTFAMADRAITAWHTARTDREIAAAAAQMERVLKLLSKVMTRYDQEVPLKDPDQEESSETFIKLERKKEQSRRIAGELVDAYNVTVERYNDKVTGFPGSWIAWVAGLHERAPLFAGSR